LLDHINYTPLNDGWFCTQYALTEKDVDDASSAISRLTDQDGSLFKRAWTITNLTNELERPCYTGSKFVWINSNGDVICCCYGLYVLGNIKKDNFMKIWTSDRYIAFRKQVLSMHITKQKPEITNCTRCPMPASYEISLGDDAQKLRGILKDFYG
jgi:MoaA/NifB/PqqE/SkfB family radical SAM enzyme